MASRDHIVFLLLLFSRHPLSRAWSRRGFDRARHLLRPVKLVVCLRLRITRLIRPGALFVGSFLDCLLIALPFSRITGVDSRSRPQV